jgi:sirohydrochlorin ferrochelatase
MPELSCTVRRVGDYESRTEEYEVLYTVGDRAPHGLRIRYQAARAYEINAALDAAVETAKTAISEADLRGPTDEVLSQFAWRAIQSAKYEEGAPRTSRLQL